jgi:hypothetical protein
MQVSLKPFSRMNPRRRGCGIGIHTRTHRISVTDLEVRASATRWNPPRSLSWRTQTLGVILLGAAIACAGRSTSSDATVSLFDQQEDKRDRSYYANAHPYLEEPLKKLRGLIPELDSVRPAADPEALPTILGKTGRNVDDFFHHIVDLTALEQVTQSRLNDMDVVTVSARVKDNYLLLFHVGELRTDLEEYRMDAEGNRMDPVGLDKGYVVTFGFALICNYFSSALQPESRFRYLGDQKMGTRDTYVVAFAQQPSVATLFTTLTGAKGQIVNMLMQGIAWVDKSNFQIVRMRTDLLAPRPEAGLNRETTEVTFSKVQLLDVAVPLWLPEKVKVYLEYRMFDPVDGRHYEWRYLNEHRYSDYRRYRVAVKMLVPK